MSRQQCVEITAKLYKCREQQVFLSGKGGFAETVEKWRPVVVAAMEKFQCNEIEALIDLLAIAEQKPNGGMMMHILNAVVVEMIEPSLTLDQIEGIQT